MFLQRNVNLDFVNGQWVNKDPRFTGINLAENIGYIKYNALQTRGEYRGNAAADRTLVHAVEGHIEQQHERRRRRSWRPTRSTCRSTTARPTRTAATSSVMDGSYEFPLDFQLAGIYRYYSALPYSVSSRFVINARPEPRNSRRGDDEKNLDLRVGKTVQAAAQCVGVVLLGDVQRAQRRQLSGLPGSLESSTFGQPGRALPKRRQQFGFRVEF